MCGAHERGFRAGACGCHDRRGERFLEAWLLLLLKSGPSHGYHLVERLGQALGGGGVPDPGTVYRNLRRMEEEGLVSSTWGLQDSGPPRRLYRLTDQGEELLHVWAANVEHYQARLDRFLGIYREIAGDSRA